jgi:hypothetical protein
MYDDYGNTVTTTYADYRDNEVGRLADINNINDDLAEAIYEYWTNDMCMIVNDAVMFRLERKAEKAGLTLEDTRDMFMKYRFWEYDNANKRG